MADAPADFATEATLDTQVVRAVAPGAQIMVYGFPATTTFGAAMDAIVEDGLAQIVSVSYGKCYAARLHRPRRGAGSPGGVAERRLAGVTLFAASGDWGAFSCHAFDKTDGARLDVLPGLHRQRGERRGHAPGGRSRRQLPARDRLGGLPHDQWHRRRCGRCDRSGGVVLEPLPDFQQGVEGIDQAKARQCPDVAAAADSDTGYLLFATDPESGEADWKMVGGTSASAPFWAGVMALVQQQAQAAGIDKLGFLGPVLYQARRPTRRRSTTSPGVATSRMSRVSAGTVQRGSALPMSRCCRGPSSRRSAAPPTERPGKRVSGRGRPAEGPFRYRHPVEVRYGDTDALGHVNNAIYLSYFEAARGGYYAAVAGRPFGTGPDAARQTFVIADARVVYRQPAYFGEPLVVEARVDWASRSSFGLEYRVLSEGGPLAPARLVADGETTQVMFDIRAGRPTRIPVELLTLIEAFEGRSIPTRP